MRVLRGFAVYSIVTLVLLSVLMDGVEGRRKILRGRKTITRTYYRPPAIPAWSIVLIVGAVIILIGGALYAVLNRVVLGSRNDESEREYP